MVKSPLYKHLNNGDLLIACSETRVKAIVVHILPASWNGPKPMEDDAGDFSPRCRYQWIGLRENLNRNHGFYHEI
jgi:hypothetical protein